MTIRYFPRSNSKNRTVPGLLMVALALWSGQGLAKVKVGDVPPDYLGTDFHGDDVSVGQYKGKVLIVTFWATWCGPCRQEIPILEGLQKAAGHEALGVVAVNFNEDDDTWHAMRRKLSELEIRITHDISQKVTRAYDVHSLPHMFMIDKSGRVAVVRMGYGDSHLGDILGEVNTLLVQPAPGGSASASTGTGATPLAAP